jgi:hypothetical protein
MNTQTEEEGVMTCNNFEKSEQTSVFYGTVYFDIAGKIYIKF